MSVWFSEVGIIADFRRKDCDVYHGVDPVRLELRPTKCDWRLIHFRQSPLMCDTDNPIPGIYQCRSRDAVFYRALGEVDIFFTMKQQALFHYPGC